MNQRDLLIIGGGPAGAAAAIVAARAGARVTLFEKGPHGRDKVCGDGLTPRAVKALDDLGIDLAPAHRTEGVRMIAFNSTRELSWPSGGRFPSHGAVWPRHRFDTHLIDVAIASGADVRFETEALPELEGGRVVGVRAGGEQWRAPLTILAAGAQGAAAKILGAERDPDEPFGLAIRAYAPSPRHADRHLEARLSLRDEHGTPVPGYGWLFPAGDGTVNIGVGVLSSARDFKGTNVAHLLDVFVEQIADRWQIEPSEATGRVRVARIPMGGSVQPTAGPTFLVVGDAAGVASPFTGAGIDAAYETGRMAADVVHRALAEAGPTALQGFPRQMADIYAEQYQLARLWGRLLGRPAVMSRVAGAAVRSGAVGDTLLRIMSGSLRHDEFGTPETVARLATTVLTVAPEA